LALNYNGDDSVHDGANGGVVVEGNERIHLELSARKKALNHGKTGSLADDAGHGEEESGEDELDLANRSNDDTDNDGSDISKGLERWRGDAEGPSCEQCSDRCGGLR
jgi:hypothetical protein